MATDENEVERGCLAVIGGAVLLPALVAASAAADGFILSRLWGWFVVPVFHAPPLTVGAGFGVCLTWAVFQGQSYLKSEYEYGLWFKLFVRFVVKPPLILGVGYAAHWLILNGYLSLTY